ncbi:hypothetical protein TVAG_009690 [Trichomonas vaginalis G3]|uniref:Uncharacterized protein n=1 Tax=Trichomonas vaginalis (strain ATCC PRA-98 / G3) TaxID=412133 RepID=A2ET45_TRIV3|nr:hypothetical protein TVAGG3_0468150 [Trichomonas vaginalis G3]EAY04161.1 hypothetical protein TVAG_009690 [Trichomonas vaginalis G3]KAI5514877.1 hypothetical protein TVAGG3_0468150 [Trichomonas vaginalis G3]|eukprot:XP_001316384.1 hypothetical protein [Trichomonas vaginalis G3]
MRATEPPEVSVATIEGIILRNSITFETLVGTNNFGIAWSQRSPIVLQYIVDHIDEVMRYALMITPPPASGLQGICLSILSSRETELYNKLFDSQTFLNIVQEIPQNITKYTVRTQVMYFDLINTILIQTNFTLFNQFDMKQYFKVLASTLIHDTPARFIQSMVISLTPLSFSVLSNAELVKILCQEYINDTVNGITALRLIQNCFINEFFLRHAAESFGDRTLILNIWKKADKTRDVHGIDFLRTLFLTCVPFISLKEWKYVADELIKLLPNVSRILLSMSYYGIYENSIGKLFIALQNGSGQVEQSGFDITVNAIDMMFKQPINSFVHNFAMYSVQSFVQCNGDIDLLLEKTQLPKKIIQQYLKRGQVTAVYWGQLRVISETIEPYIDTTHLSNWSNIITESNQNTRHLMDVPLEESHPILNKKQTSSLLLALHRLPKRKRAVLMVGLISFILFIYVAIFV